MVLEGQDPAGGPPFMAGGYGVVSEGRVDPHFMAGGYGVVSEGWVNPPYGIWVLLGDFRAYLM